MSESYLVINYVIEVRKTGRDRITGPCTAQRRPGNFGDHEVRRAMEAQRHLKKSDLSGLDLVRACWPDAGHADARLPGVGRADHVQPADRSVLGGAGRGPARPRRACPIRRRQSSRLLELADPAGRGGALIGRLVTSRRGMLATALASSVLTGLLALRILSPSDVVRLRGRQLQAGIQPVARACRTVPLEKIWMSERASRSAQVTTAPSVYLPTIRSCSRTPYPNRDGLQT